MVQPPFRYPMSINLEQKHLLWLVAIGLLACLLWFTWEKGQVGKKGPWTIDLSGIKADLTLTGVSYTRSSEGRVKWVVHADSARLYEQKKLILMDNVTIDFFTSSGDKVIVIADSGEYDTAKEQMLLKGHVKVVSQQGERLFTNSLRFNQKKALIWSYDKVLIQTGDMEIKGKGFEYDLKRGKFTVKRQKAVIRDEDIL